MRALAGVLLFPGLAALAVSFLRVEPLLGLSRWCTQWWWLLLCAGIAAYLSIAAAAWLSGALAHRRVDDR